MRLSLLLLLILAAPLAAQEDDDAEPAPAAEAAPAPGRIHRMSKGMSVFRSKAPVKTTPAQTKTAAPAVAAPDAEEEEDEAPEAAEPAAPQPRGATTGSDGGRWRGPLTKKQGGGPAGTAAAAAGGGGVDSSTIGGQAAGPNGPVTAADLGPGCPMPPKNVVMKRIYPGQGSHNFIFDEPRYDGLPPTIYAFRLPTWGGRMSKNAGFVFARTEVLSPKAEIAFSRCPGDFTWGKKYSYQVPKQKAHEVDSNGCFLLANGESNTQYPGHKCYAGAVNIDQKVNPCYNHAPLDASNLAYAVGKPSANYTEDSMKYFYACPIPPQPDGKTWYMNVRYVDEQGNGTCPNLKWQCSTVFNWHAVDTGWQKGNNEWWAEPLPEEKANEFYGGRQIANHYRPQTHWDGFCSTPGPRGNEHVLEPDCRPRK